MAAIPLSIAAPAAAASLAYLSARTYLPGDLAVLKASISGALYFKRCERNDRVNLFYELENNARNAKTSNRAFLAVPPTLPKDVQQPRDLQGLECLEWSYKQTYDTVLQFAAWLKQEHGVKKNDMVAIDFTNKPQFVFLWFALFSLGAKTAFLNTNLRGKAFVHCVKACDANLLILDPAIQDALTPEVQGELASVKTVVLDEVTESRIYSLRGLRVPDEERSGNKGSDTAVLIFTSGTTGLPKPAVVPWKKFLLSSKMVSLWLAVKPTDRFYTAMPLYHSSASVLNISVTLHSSATSVISNHFSPRTFFASVSASKATIIQYIGEMCRYLLSVPPTPFDQHHNVRMAFGNGLRPDVWLAFKNRFSITEIAEFYSATEAVGGTFVKSKNEFGVGAVGRTGSLVQALMGSQSALVVHDTETGEPQRDAKTGFCQRVKVGEPGEMINALDPANIADKYVGYFNNAKASESKILRDVFKKGDAWYRSGDLLRRDREGRLFFVDRTGDTYRWKSENVSTNEVAEALATSPHVDQVNVYGVTLPNHDGRAGCAALIFTAHPTDSVLRDLARHARERLPKFAVPVFLRRVKTFETTGTAKYTKHGLREQGVDVARVGDDEVFWLPPGADSYLPFREGEWNRVVGGDAKL